MRPLIYRRRTRVLELGRPVVTWYTPQQIATVHALRREGATVAAIARATGWAYHRVRRMLDMQVVADQGARQEAAAALADEIPLP